MKTKVLSILFVSAFMMYSCDTKKEDVVVVDDTEDVVMDTIDNVDVAMDDHTAKSSLDWNATYKGILPCADCEGIETELELNNDNTYELERKYLGKNDIKEETKGSFTWVDDNHIQLDGVAQGESAHYKIEENRVRVLNSDGTPVTGELAEKYVLLKK